MYVCMYVGMYVCMHQSVTCKEGMNQVSQEGMSAYVGPVCPDGFARLRNRSSSKGVERRVVLINPRPLALRAAQAFHGIPEASAKRTVHRRRANAS